MWQERMSSKCGLFDESSKVMLDLIASTPNSANRFNALIVRCVAARRRRVNATKQMITANATNIKTMLLKNDVHAEQ